MTLTTYSDRDGQVRLHATPSPDPLGQPLALTGAVSPTRYVGGNASGAPLTGTFAVGDFVVNADASIFVCTVAGSPGTWVDTATVGPSVASVFSRTGTVVAGNADYLAVASGGLTGAVAATRYVGGTASVAPTTGTFAVGDFVVTATGRIWVCTAAGTPGTWVEPASVTFAPKASPTFTGTVTVPAAAAVTSATKLADLSSYLTIASGALPAFGAWSSGTAQQNPVTRDIHVAVEVVTDGTADAATCAIAISADNSTFTTIGTPGSSAAVNTVGADTTLTCVPLPQAWWIKLTFSHCTIAASKYY